MHIYRGQADRSEPDVAVLYLTKYAKPRRDWDELLTFEEEIGRQLGVLTASPGCTVSPALEELKARTSDTIATPCFYSELINAVTSLQAAATSSVRATADDNHTALR